MYVEDMMAGYPPYLKNVQRTLNSELDLPPGFHDDSSHIAIHNLVVCTSEYILYTVAPGNGKRQIETGLID